VEPLMDSRPAVCVDLDGVLNTFDEWRGPEFFHPPREGAREFLSALHGSGFRVVILTVRWHEWVRAWLEQHGLSEFVDEVTDRKPPAHAYVDDRAVCFRGDFSETLRHILEFRPFWERNAAL
jgi:phosphoserine phosphatase